MNIKDIIRKKRNGDVLQKEELEFMVCSLTEERLEREQVGALLMAIWIKGMDISETAHFTNAMRYSGTTMEWPAEWKDLVVDKHSTGGVGDKVSLVLTPALAACGLKVPMISGRALAHTGGTLDKLEAIPGFFVAQSPQNIKRLMDEVGCCIVGQTEDLVPADRILYSSRDVTSTIDSLPLIVSSIISKKAAENPSALIIDVKFGRGAFMNDKEDARRLAKAMVDVSNNIGIKTAALMTSMEHPLGYYVGNALEVFEALQCLHGGGPSDLEDLVVMEGALLLRSVGKSSDLDTCREMIRKVIHNGEALEKFRKMAVGQGTSENDARRLCQRGEEFAVMAQARYTSSVCASSSGFIHGVEPMCLSRVTAALGGARHGHDDKINHAVGVVLHSKPGQQVTKGDVVATIHHDTSPLDQKIIDDVTNAIEINDAVPNEFQLIGDIIE